MVPRLLQGTLTARLKTSPAVALIGARQSGKTTLAKVLSRHYYDLERPEDRLKLDVEWEKALSRQGPVVLDEAQVWPELFPRLRAAIDQDRKRKGRFLILGSISPALMREVSESLTGRIALVELHSLLLSEVGQKGIDKLWLVGGYPEGGVLGGGRYPDWQIDYLTLLAERDLPQWGLPAKPQVTLSLFRMLAALNGTVWNASALGKSLGLSYHTVNSYLDYLEHAFLIRRLPPYHRNIKKRLVKSPKIYWRDSGLVHALLGVRDRNALFNQPWVGLSWEGWVIDQILGFLKTKGESFEAFFLRTQDQQEIDLILEWQGHRIAFEIKLSSGPDERDLAKLNGLADWIDADQRVLLSRTEKTVQNKTVLSTHLAGFLHGLDL